jgi:PAS domain S-box-containing protein
MFSALNFSQRIAMAIILIVMVFVSGVGGLSYRAMYNANYKNLTDELVFRSHAVTDHTEGRIKGIHRNLLEMGTNTLIGNALVDNIGSNVYLANFLDGFHLIEGIPVQVLVTDFMGKPFSSNIVGASLVHPREWIEEAIAKDETRTTIVLFEGNFVFVFVKPVLFANTGLPEGALVYQFTLKDLLNEEEIINAWQSSAFMSGVRLTFLDKLSGSKGSIISGAKESTSLINSKTLGLGKMFPNLEMTLQVFGDSRQFDSLLDNVLKTYFLMGGFALILAIGAGFVISRLLTSKLEGLEKSASTIAKKGKISERLGAEGEDEISRFAGSFNSVLDRLEAAYRDLENQTKMQIDRQEEKYQRVVEQAGEALMIFDASGRVVEANLRAIGLLGYSAEEIVKLTVPDLVSDWQQINFQTHFEAVRKRDVETFEAMLITNGDNNIPVEITAGIVELENGLHLLWVARDITERKQTEIRLLKLTSAVEQSPATVLVTDLDGNIEYVNPKFEETTGYTAAEALGKNSRMLKSGQTTLEEYQDLWRSILSGKEWHGEFHNKRKDGTHYWESAIISPIKTPEGIVTNFLAVKEDITERKRVEEELKEAKALAEEANNAKSEFLAAMSHDLRTPLNAIMGFAEMMELRTFGKLGDPHYEMYAKNIHDSGNLLVSLINDVLDLSKVEAGKYELLEEALDTTKLIQSNIRMITPQVQEKGITLDFELPVNMPKLLADERVLIQILNNLLSNSIKFTPAGGNVTVTSAVNGSGDLTIKIADTGIGMSDADIERALQPFEQANSNLSRRHEGTGLGLHLCKNFMKLHGGSMTIESKEGEGTVATVSFPKQRVLAADSL